MIVTQHPEMIEYRRNKVVRDGKSSPWYIMEETKGDENMLVLYLGNGICKMFEKAFIRDTAHREEIIKEWEAEMSACGHYEWEGDKINEN